jgi:hypothetical protein
MNLKNSHIARLFVLISFALIPILESSCATQETDKRPHSVFSGYRPEWIDGDSPQYPRSRYLVGLGIADDEVSAAERARGEIARTFSADVNVDTSVEQTEISSDKSSSLTSTISHNVHTSAQKILEGVDIVSRWKDPSAGRYYALAALSKSQAILSLTERAHALDDEGQRFKSKLAETSNLLERAKAAAKLNALAKNRASLEADYRVLAGGALPGEFDTVFARSESAKALAALDILVSVTGPEAYVIETAIIGGLNALGMSAKRPVTGSKSDLLVTSEVNVNSQESGDPRWKRARATATVSIQETPSGKVFSRFDVSAREDALEVGEARIRALKTLSKKTTDKVATSISDFLTN